MLTGSGAMNRLVAQAAGEGAPPAADEANVAATPPDAAAGEGRAAGGQEKKQPPKTLSNELLKWPETTSEWVGVGFYLVLLVFSLVAATVAVERLFNLKLKNVVPAEFADRLNDMVRRREDSQQNLRVLADSTATPIGRVLKAAIFRAGRPWSEVEKGMDDEMAWEMAALRGRHRALTVVGSVAPLVGLLGTVIGMIFAFMVTSQDSDAGRQAAELGRGIYLALLTTAAGLTIAIPCLLLAARFNAQVERYMRRMNETLLRTMNSFVRMERQSHVISTSSPAAAENDARANDTPESEPVESDGAARAPISAK